MMKQEMNKHLEIKALNIPFDELKYGVNKFKQMITFKEEREIIVKKANSIDNSLESERTSHPKSKSVIKARGANLSNEVG